MNMDLMDGFQLMKSQLRCNIELQKTTKTVTKRISDLSD